MCLCARVQVCICQDMFVEIRGQPPFSIFVFSILGDRKGLLVTSGYSRLADPKAFEKGSLVFTSLSYLRSIWFTVTFCCVWLCLGSEDSNSGSHTCSGIALPTEPHPQILYIFKVYMVKHASNVKSLR